MSLRRAARVAALALVLALAGWALVVLSVGLPATTVREARPGEPLPPAETIYVPYGGAVFSLLALLVVAIGLLRDEWLPLAWVGVGLHLGFGVLLIWGLGILYIAAAGVLAAPVGVLHWQVRGRRAGLWGAWAGAALVLAVGLLLRGTAISPWLLALAGLLGVGLGVLQRHSS